MATDTIREAMSPGTITTLGSLRPGDVGVFVHDNGVQTSQFVFLETVERPGWGRVAVAQFEGGGYIDEPWLARPVRYLGRGRIEPARVVLDSEPDRVRELEAQVRTLREFVHECATDFDCDRDAHRYQTFCRQCEARAVLAATAPKEKPCTT